MSKNVVCKADPRQTNIIVSDLNVLPIQLMPKRKNNKNQIRTDAHPKKEKDQKSKMMIAMQIALVAGTIGAVVGGFLISYGNHKIVSVWITFAGVVLIALSGALYLHAEALPSWVALDPSPPPSPQPQSTAGPNQPVNISSINQMGGITAHTVNLRDEEAVSRVAALEAKAKAEADALSAKTKMEANEKARKEVEERPNTIFQQGKPVAKALAMTLDEVNGMAFFPEITNSKEMNVDKPFEYRSFKLQMTHAETMIGASFPDEGKGQIVQGAKCKIIKKAN